VLAEVDYLAMTREGGTIGTLDHTHYRVLRPLNGGRFSILP